MDNVVFGVGKSEIQNSQSKIRNPKSQILKALFAEANRLGIDQETLRDDIAPAVINKRLSSATPQEVARVLNHIHGGNPKSPRLSSAQAETCGERSRTIRNPKSYESSRRGLLQEVADLARQRYGEDFVKPLNALCDRFKVEGYRSLKVNQAKAVKATLIRLQREDPRGEKSKIRNPKPVVSGAEPSEIQNPKSNHGMA